MALRTFETDTAKYYLGLGRHDRSSAPIFEDVDFGSLDFMVLEDGSSPVKMASKFFNDCQYKAIYLRLKKENEAPRIYSIDQASSTYLPIYTAYTSISMTLSYILSLAGVGEIDHNHISQGLELLASGIILGSDLPLMFSLASSGKKSRPLTTAFQNVKTNLIPTPLVSFRDAIAAKKTAEYLVPKHRHQDGSKVNVGILYGAAHSGIETKLKYPWIADATITFYHYLLGFGDRTALNEVREVIPEEENVRRYDCDLFK